MALKDIPDSFSIDSEEDVRFAVACYFKDFGFDIDEISFEDHFTIQLGHSQFTVHNTNKNRDIAHGYSDLLLIRNGKPLAIVEVKRIDHKLDDDDAWQSISYARLLRRQVAPYAIVTNGVETKVYDPLADSDELVEIDSPLDAVWNKHGQTISSINDDLRYEASRKIIGINPQTLSSFCQSQVAYSLEDLRGNINEFKLYVPDIYFSRQAIASEFSKWLKDDLPCFAVVGESGVGKTNFMCATAESQLGDDFALFYSAKNLTRGLVGALINDFLWEFRRENNIAHIVERFDEIVAKHGKRLIIFVDALDEYIGDQLALKAELLDFIYRIRGKAIRLCLSCKAYDWEVFVIDNGQSYNRLAKSIYPLRREVHHPEKLQDVKANNVGVLLRSFTNTELDKVFGLYKKVFDLQGELRDEVRIECELPLMLRLLAEVYSGQKTNIPADLSSKKLFDTFWKRKLNKISSPLVAEQLLSKIAEISVETNNRKVALGVLLQAINLSETINITYDELAREGLINVINDDSGEKILSFSFEKLRSYVYVIHSKRWKSQGSPETAQDICELLRKPNQLKLEAIEFYLTTVDLGGTDVLIEIALLNIDFFRRLIQVGYMTSKPSGSINHLDDKEKSGILFDRLVQYVQTYSRISRHYFPHLYNRIVPYTKNPVGLLVDENYHLFQLRSTTTQYPQPLLILPSETAGRWFSNKLTQKEWVEMGKPIGTTKWGFPQLEDHLPQKIAWQELETQISKALEKGLLDESSSDEIITERVQEILFHEQISWRKENSIGGARLFELLGFINHDEVYTVTIQELIERSNLLISQYTDQIKQDMEAENSRRYPLSLRMRIDYLAILKYWLNVLSKSKTKLQNPLIDTHEMFLNCIRNPFGCMPVLLQLIPTILKAYHSIVDLNFPGLADQLMLSKHRNSFVLIEATHEHQSDYIQLRYILFPSITSISPRVIATRRKESLAELPVYHKKTFWRSESWSKGGRFGETRVSREVDGELIEGDAIIYRTRFPSRQPISDQVYQLIAVELQEFFGGGFMVWHQSESPRIDYGLLARILDGLRSETNSFVIRTS